MRLASWVNSMSNWTLMEADCLATLREMPDNYADVLMTDPPFVLAGPAATASVEGGGLMDNSFVIGSLRCSVSVGGW